ncbi:MAG TPA: hypothetical protein PL117_03215 [Accumulibacter sp.]|uniref:hypothetical protein n=1 Tax=Accumulibacter sp. TaxID=2053492 RepID=UPI002D1741FC|nr:hypothetical protein [Accumulibacter sp.]HRF71757.1 hypothetical protein [Accumulibacter sp.]
MPERVLTRYQYGPETVRGTPVAATRILGADPKAVPNDRVWNQVRYGTGRRGGAQQKRNDTYLVKDTLNFSNVYFQALPALLQCSIDGTIAPAEQTPTQQDYLWSAVPLWSAPNTPSTLSVQLGDDVQAWVMEHLMFDRLKFAWGVPQDGEVAPVSCEAGYFAKQLTAQAFTAGLSLPSNLAMLNGKLTRMWIDSTFASAGTTEITNTLRGGEIELLNGNHPKFFGSGQRYFDGYGEGDIVGMATLTLEGNANALAAYNDFRAGTPRVLRIEFQGPALGTGQAMRFRVDMAGYWEIVTPVNSESKGNNLTRGVFRTLDDGTNVLAASVITNINAL